MTEHLFPYTKIDDERLAEIVIMDAEGYPPMSKYPSFEERRAITRELQQVRKELATLYEKLRNPHVVLTSILRGEIALRHEAAIHIAGLPANIADVVIAGRKLAKAMEQFIWEPLCSGSCRSGCRSCHSIAGRPHSPDCEIFAALEGYYATMDAIASESGLKVPTRFPEEEGYYRCNPDGTFTKLDSNIDLGSSSDENRT